MSIADPLPENHNSAIQPSSAATLVAAANAASFMLIEMAVFVNADTSEFVQSGVKIGGKPVGDWRITVQKIEPEQPQEKQLEKQMEMFDVPVAAPAAGPGHGDS